ncbi:MAG: hypothetical protein VW438_00455 [Euryarchaeota archaeon]
MLLFTRWHWALHLTFWLIVAVSIVHYGGERNSIPLSIGQDPSSWEMGLEPQLQLPGPDAATEDPYTNEGSGDEKKFVEVLDI